MADFRPPANLVLQFGGYPPCRADRGVTTIRHSQDETIPCANVPSPVISPEPPSAVRGEPVRYSDLLLQGHHPGAAHEPRARIAPEQFTRLMQMLWVGLDDEYLGFARASAAPSP
jgi:hypothetical protein